MKERAPQFELSYINQPSTYRLSDHFGKVIVLTFWASWCPDCGRDLPKKEQLFETMDKEKVELVTINVPGRERSPDAGKEYAEKFLNQPTLIDDGRSLYDTFGCKGVPSTIIIDQEGRVHESFGDKASFLDIVQSLGEIV